MGILKNLFQEVEISMSPFRCVGLLSPSSLVNMRRGSSSCGPTLECAEFGKKKAFDCKTKNILDALKL